MKIEEVTNIKLTLYGKAIELVLSVPKKQVTPVNLLPALHEIDNKFVATAVEVFVEKNEAISCKAGCGACCRQPVPLAEFEAYQIASLVEQLPISRRTAIKKKFSEAYEKLESINWLKHLEELLENSATKEEIQTHALAYFYQNIACPFLEAESCSIYLDRPLACREYLVTSPAENCKKPTIETIKHIELKFQVSKIVRKLWKTSYTKDLDSVPMIYALEWVKKHPNKFDKKRGEKWLTEFFNYLSNSK
jgi:Fe-S-cluster containining protein